LRDPFASKLDPFSWLNLQTSMDFEIGEGEKKGGVAPRLGTEVLVNNG
jgi:hypothetical protein